MSDNITTEVIVEYGAATARNRRTTLQMHWRKSDPFAVSLLLTAQPDHPALPRGRWMVLRDFLRYGMEEPTGDGDVRIRPDPDHRNVHLELIRGGRPCTIAIPCDTMRAFLDATDDIIPAGEERTDEALDALIEELLRR